MKRPRYKFYYSAARTSVLHGDEPRPRRSSEHVNSTPCERLRLAPEELWLALATPFVSNVARLKSNSMSSRSKIQHITQIAQACHIDRDPTLPSFPIVKLPYDASRRYTWQSRFTCMGDEHEQGGIGATWTRYGEVRVGRHLLCRVFLSKYHSFLLEILNSILFLRNT
jgi:hypothetical protein